MSVPSRQKEDVRRNESLGPRPNRLDIVDNHLEDDGQVLQREDEHLIRLALIPDEGIGNPFFVFVLSPTPKVSKEELESQCELTSNSPPFEALPNSHSIQPGLPFPAA